VVKLGIGDITHIYTHTHTLHKSHLIPVPHKRKGNFRDLSGIPKEANAVFKSSSNHVVPEPSWYFMIILHLSTL
jgi:hypothetical protein